MDSSFKEEEFLAFCGSTKFAKKMVVAEPFHNYEQAVEAYKDIWFNKVDVNGWLEVFAAHPQIRDTSSANRKSGTSSQ